MKYWRLLWIVSLSSLWAELIGPGSSFRLSDVNWTYLTSIHDSAGKDVKWKYTGFTPGLNNPPNFTVVVPANGTTRSNSIRITLNRKVAALLRPGFAYSLTLNFTTVDEDPPSTTGFIVSYVAPSQPAPIISAVVNSASFQPPLTPGA